MNACCEPASIFWVNEETESLFSKRFRIDARWVPSAVDQPKRLTSGFYQARCLGWLHVFWCLIWRVSALLCAPGTTMCVFRFFYVLSWNCDVMFISYVQRYLLINRLIDNQKHISDKIFRLKIETSNIDTLLRSYVVSRSKVFLMNIYINVLMTIE